MLNIAIVTNNYKPYSGGIVSSIDSFALNLINQGHKVSIITLDFHSNSQQDDNVFRLYSPIKFIYKNNPIAIPLLPNQNLMKLIKALKPDIIHSQHPFLLGKSALYVSKKLNIPLIFTYHTRYDQYCHYIPLPQFITKTFAKRLSLSYCNETNGIVAPSESILKYLNENNINKPIQVIASGILPIFQSNIMNQKKIKSKFHLLTVSRFVKEKNIYFLLDVFSKLNQHNFIFTLIGYGIEIHNLKYYAYKTLGLSEENIKFIEKPSKEIILSHYKESDLFIFASKTETQGLVLAEAMSCGTPVIAINATGSCDIIKNNINGFLVNSMNEMIEKILLISNNHTLHYNMQKEAWKTGQSYNSYSMTQNLIEFYYKVISSKINNR